MDPREERGLIIAATCRLNRLDDGTWIVPSQTSRDGGAYRVNLHTKTCTCPDHVEGGNTCKHYYAASFVHKRDVLPDGTVIETKTITLTEKKVYKQDWPAYNVAQATEKRRVRVLLHDLCRRLPNRQKLSLKERWYSCACGNSRHRDENAALNVLQAGRVCWASSSPVGGLAQEAAGL